MPRLILLAALLAGLVAAVPSSAQVGSGRIAYSDEFGHVLTVTADGRAPVVFRPARGFRLSFPRWSPDGSRIAFTEYSGTPGQFRLLVADQDGSDEHVVATGNIFLGRQPWSPDGSRIAWGPSGEGDLFTASAEGGDVRRLTTDGLRKDPPSWSPAGQSLVYAGRLAGPERWELFVVGDDGSAPRQITSGGEGNVRNVQPSWSPSGGSIAFLRQINSAYAIYMVRPDGTERHRVAGVSAVSSGWPVWSPDGAKIAYTNSVNTGYGRFGGQGQEIFVVNADGSGERRLTELAPRLTVDSTPVWSPDGDQILFLRGGSLSSSLLTMNPDGTCEGALSAQRVAEAPSWQAVPGGPAIGSKTCGAVAIETTTSVFRRGAAVIISATVSNEGTEPLTNVQLTISAIRNDLSLQALEGHPCTRRNTVFVCRIDRIGRGEVQRVAVLGTARRVGRNVSSRSVPLLARLEVTADGPLLATGREVGGAAFTPDRCVPSDPGRGSVIGTRFPDRICGRVGPDYIDPEDRKDYVYSGAGPDVINTGDGYGDVISCGPGRDLVFADRKDKVSRDCERVLRR